MRPFQTLKELRKNQRMTIDELSTKSGVSKATISLVENKKEVANSDVVIKLAEALGCSTDFLLKGKEHDSVSYSHNYNDHSIVGSNSNYNEKGIVENNNNYNCVNNGLMKKMYIDIENAHKTIYKLQEELIATHKQHNEAITKLYEQLMDRGN